MRLLTIALTATLTCTPLLLIGCAGGGSSSSESESAAPVKAKVFAEPVSIVAKISGDELPIESHGLAILDQDAINGLGLSAAFANDGVTLDPAKHSVVLLSLGKQNTGGFEADITGLQLKGDRLYVQGTAVAPGASASQVITYPYCAVAVEKLPAGVTTLSDITSLP